MCGIVGYIGTKKASPILINGLLKLEYRGYDSAGISTMEKDSISVMKDKGRVKNLYDLEGINDLKGTVGIAHTRWATHGKPSKENSHPHLDNSNTFCVVHNGIIENYNDLRTFLKDNGYEFYYKKGNDFLKSVNLACNDLKGSYAIEVICKDMPENMIVARKDSPLVIGKSDDEIFVSSDIPALISFTNTFYFLNDNEIAYISNDNNLNEVSKELTTVELSANSADKDGFEDYMLKEIYEQPKAIRETIGTSLNGSKINFEGLNLTKEYLSKINKIYMVACGTAMHAGLGVKSNFETLCNIPVIVEVASEFRYRNPLIDENTLCIYISQSGETADTIAALKLAKSKGAKTIAITNVIESSITREADYFVYTHAGPEIAVASTKAYTSQLVLLNIMALYFAEILESSTESRIDNIKKEILKLPEKAEEILKDITNIKNIAHEIHSKKTMFYLGRGIDYSVAMEGALKLKESSYIFSEAYPSGELKHGPIALIEKGTSVINILTNSTLVEKSLSNIQEVVTRGATCIIITNQDFDISNFENVIKIPEISALLSPILSVIPLQLLAYYITKEKGLDVDKPRNLAKSVTVE